MAFLVSQASSSSSTFPSSSRISLTRFCFSWAYYRLASSISSTLLLLAVPALFMSTVIHQNITIMHINIIEYHSNMCMHKKIKSDPVSERIHETG